MIIIDDYSEKNFIQKILISFCYLLKYKIYFINSLSNNISKKIKPLPIENIEWINCQEDTDADPNEKGFRDIKNLLTKKIRLNIIELFEKKISDEEIDTVLKRILAWNYIKIVTKVDLFFEKQIVNKKKKEKIYLFIFNKAHFILPKFKYNINFYRLIFFTEIEIILKKIFDKIIFFFEISKNNVLQKKYFQEEKSEKTDFNIFHILHDGIFYGNDQNKWNKNYLDLKILNKERIAIIDYTKNYKLKKCDYFYISPRYLELRKHITLNQLYKNFRYFLNFKSINDFFLLSCFNKLLLETKFYILKYSQFKNVKFAIIDYIELCPFPIIFALRELNIKTIGIQQRFITFNYSYFQIILDFYLVNSKMIENNLKKNKNIKNIIVTGQWRTKFFKKKININKKTKRITALMYFYWMNDVHSQTKITVNDKNSNYFLNQLIKLSYQLENTEIFLKFKTTQWLDSNSSEDNYLVKRFLNKLRQNKKVKIEKKLNSYDSCSISDLVISKPTSLCDELISERIPTLISLDSHNLKIKKNIVYNYFHKDIFVSSYNELLLKTKKILMNDNYFKSIYFNSSRRLYDRGIFNNTNKLTNEIVKIIDGKFDKSC